MLLKNDSIANPSGENSLTTLISLPRQTHISWSQNELPHRDVKVYFGVLGETCDGTRVARWAVCARVTKVVFGKLTEEDPVEAATTLDFGSAVEVSTFSSTGDDSSRGVMVASDPTSGRIVGSGTKEEDVEVWTGGIVSRVSMGKIAKSRFTSGRSLASVVEFEFLSSTLMTPVAIRPMTTKIPTKARSTAMMRTNESLWVFFSCRQRLMCSLGSNFSVDPVYSTERTSHRLRSSSGRYVRIVPIEYYVSRQRTRCGLPVFARVDLTQTWAIWFGDRGFIPGFR